MLTPTQLSKLQLTDNLYPDDTPGERDWFAVDVATDRDNTTVVLDDVLLESDEDDARPTNFFTVDAASTGEGEPLYWTYLANDSGDDKGALYVPTDGLTDCIVKIKHIDHRYVRRGIDETGIFADGSGEDETGLIVSDVFGDYRLVWYASKNETTPVVGEQQAVVHVGTTAMPTLIAATGAIDVDGYIPVKYAKIDGSLIPGGDMKIRATV